MTISPGTTTFQDPTVVVTIDMCAFENSLDQSTFEVFHSGVDVTSSFVLQQLANNNDCYDGRWGQARATGTITLQPGENLVGAVIYGIDFEDIDGMPVTYTLSTPGQASEKPTNVFVTPDGEPLGVPSGATRTGAFWVFNPRPETRSIQVSRSCQGQASCSASTSTHSIASNDSLNVSLAYSVSGAWKQVGSVRVVGTDLGNGMADTGSLSITVAPAQESELPPILSPSLVRRDLCVNIAAGLSGAIECGDLRLAHSLPSTMAMGVSRTPMLTYSSQHATPVVLTSANVTWPAGESVSATANIKLFVNSVLVDERNWPGSHWSTPGQTRRITARLNASSYETGVYPYV
ncbi:MAG: hypothetical protein ACYC2K_18245, partial [Gemmatimonadales bacterium]